MINSYPLQIHQETWGARDTTPTPLHQPPNLHAPTPTPPPLVPFADTPTPPPCRCAGNESITSYSVKRDLLQCQKRPITVSKETYYSVKRDL